MKMKYWQKFMMMIAALIMTLTYSGLAFSAVTPEEAAQLGKNLTLWGAEKAGNKEGTIPAYTGGGIVAPKSYDPATGMRPNPFPNDKILFTINAQNVEQYKGKLAISTYALIKKYPKTFFLNVYQSRRTMKYPDYILKATADKVGTAKLTNEGDTLTNAWVNIPFPIPKTGHELMWNRIVYWQGIAHIYTTRQYIVDENGRMTNTSTIVQREEQPYYNPNASKIDRDNGYNTKHLTTYLGPPRSVGQQLHGFYTLDGRRGMIVYQYLPGQRRVKLAPEISHDLPDSSSAGYKTMDDSNGFEGSLERYNWKILGKKEIYIATNNYATYYNTPVPQVMTLGHPNVSGWRWELHRVWIVEGTLKPGKRHLYPRRVLYLDEDNYQMNATDQYDARGQLYRTNQGGSQLMYEKDFNDVDSGYCGTGTSFMADLLYGRYGMSLNWYDDEKGNKGQGYRRVPVEPDSFWTPQGLTGKGVR